MYYSEFQTNTHTYHTYHTHSYSQALKHHTNSYLCFFTALIVGIVVAVILSILIAIVIIIVIILIIRYIYNMQVCNIIYIYIYI